MPTFELPNGPEHCSVERYDIVGHRGGIHLSHVALADEPRQASRGDNLLVAHMGPPLGRGDPLRAHTVGRFQLDARDRRRIEFWLCKRMTERSTISYCISPASEVVRDRGRVIGRRYSCAGFVRECVAHGAALELVDQRELPSVTRARLVEIWGEATVRVGEIRGYLRGSGPWPVLLPAHLLHSLDREDPRVEPYKPGPDDWDFPQSARH